MSSREREKDKEAKFIADWNDIMDFKLDEHNLRNPNFGFFYNALESLLQSLNYDIEKIKNENSDCNDAERLYYIKFCAYIDSVYQLSGSNNNFYYIDLINPVPKKCFHVLKTLLNYLIYYEMVKKEVCTKAKEYSTAYDDALAKNLELLKRNKDAETRAAEVKYQMSEFEKALPKLQQEVNQMKMQEESYDKDIKEKNQEIKDFDKAIMKTEMRLADMNENIVSEDEYKKSIDALAALRSEMDQLVSISEHTRSSTVGSNAQADSLRKTINGINNVLESQKLSSYEELIEIQTKLNTMNEEINSRERQIQEIASKVKSSTEDIEKINAETKAKDEHLNKLKKEFERQKAGLERSNTVKNEEVHAATETLSKLQSQIDELKDQQRFLKTSFLEIIKRSLNPFNKSCD